MICDVKSSPAAGLKIFYISMIQLHCFRYFPQIPQSWRRLHAGWKDFWHAIDLNRHRRILFEPINQLLNLSIHQSNTHCTFSSWLGEIGPCHLSFSTKSPHHSSPSSSSAAFLFALDCCEVLHFFFRRDTLLDTAVQPNTARPGFTAKSLSLSLCWSVSLALFLSGGCREMNRRWWGAAMWGCLL